MVVLITSCQVDLKMEDIGVKDLDSTNVHLDQSILKLACKQQVMMMAQQHPQTPLMLSVLEILMESPTYLHL